MRLDRWLALLVIVASLAAAIATWLHAPRVDHGPAGLPGAGPAAIAMIDVYGVISDAEPDDGLLTSRGASAIKLIEAIRSAEKDGVKAILLRLNSPGGTAAASQMVYEELMRVRRAGKIKIVASMGDVTASGGYYIASAADHIVANAATTTGSIGVILHLTDVEGLMSKLGVSNSTIQSGTHKDILSPFRPVRPDERAMLQALVNETYQQFLDAVSAGRHMPLATLRPLADGRIFTGQLARKVGLVDSLGDYRVALQKAADLAGIKGEPVTRSYPGGTWFDQLMPRSEAQLPGWLGRALGGKAPAAWAKTPLALME